MGSHTSPGAREVLDGLRHVVRALREASRASERKVGLPAAQLFVLHALADAAGPLTVNSLAARTLTHQSSVSVVARKLVARRLVRRSSAPGDARAVVLSLTARGRALARRAPDPAQARLISAIGKLPPASRRALAKGLTALAAGLGAGRGRAPLFFEDEEAHR